MASKTYMEEWASICAAYCKKIQAELLFVNVDSFGIMLPNGTMRHIYADELVEILVSGERGEKE